MTSRIASLAFALIALITADGYADPPRRTVASGGGVRLAGEARVSSVGFVREPDFTLTNLTAEPRTVDLVSLASLGSDGTREALTITSGRRFVLAPRATRRITVTFGGRPISLGGGLSYYRFALTVSSGGARFTAVASSAYVCRIPLRRPEAQ